MRKGKTVKDLTYETIERMKLEPGDLVVVKRSEGKLPVVLEGFMGGLARAFPKNTFAILPPGISLEKMKAKDLKELIDDANEPRTSALAYKIKSNGRSIDTHIFDPKGEKLGYIKEMHIVADADDPLLRVKLLQLQTDKDGNVLTLEPQITALDIEIPAEQVEIVTKPFPVDSSDFALSDPKKVDSDKTS